MNSLVHRSRILRIMACLALLLGMSAPASASAPVADTGISLPATNLPPELAASSRQDKNIIWYVNVGAQDAKRDISFTISYNQAFLRTCKGMRCSEELAYNGDMSTDVSMNANNSVLLDIQYHYIGKSYGPSRTIGNVSVGPAYYQVRCDDLLLECRFLSFWDVDEKHFTISNPNGNKLTTEWVVLGDINQDGAIDSADAQIALQYSVGSGGSLTHLQERAADVNDDGVIDASDALLINQYSTKLIHSFWKDYSAPSTLPSGPTEDIQSGATYCVQNAYNANGLSATSSPSSGTVIKQNKFSASSQQVVIVYKENGEYEIRHKNNSTLVWSKNGYQLIMQTRTATASSAQRWYIIKNGEGMYTLINKAEPSRCLTVEGDSNNSTSSADDVDITTSTIGNRWRLHRLVGRTFNDYYDASFSLRNTMDSFGFVNPETGKYELGDFVCNPHPACLIGDARAAATQVFGSLLGVSIQYGSMLPYQSLADACREGNGSSVTSSIRCTSSATGHQYTDQNGNVLHCTDNSAQCDAFRNAYPVTNTVNRVNTLWSGAYLYRRGTSTQENRSNAMVSSAGPGHIHILDHLPNLQAVYIHEMSHAWGAIDHYHEEVNGTCRAGQLGICSELTCKTFKQYQNESSVHRPAACMMNNHNIFWSNHYQKLYCSYCLAEMRSYVSNNY